MILDNKTQIEELKTKYEQDDEDIKDNLKKVTDKLNVISMMVLELKKEKDHETLLALKGQLMDIYDTCKARSCITSMQLEVFREKFALYEERGGNSFVHEIIVPYIEALQVIDN